MVNEEMLTNTMQLAIDDHASDPEDINQYELKAIKRQVNEYLDNLIEAASAPDDEDKEDE